jgi:RNA polymerase sigma-70 factor (ECF subfamily)
MFSQDDSTEFCGELVHEHYKGIYSFLAYLSGDRAIAEDLTQETFLAALSCINTCKNQASLKNWLYRIAYNKFIDSKRKCTREADLKNDCEQSVCQSSETSDPINKLVSEESLYCTYEAMTKLDLHEYSAIILHYIQGFTFNEMAMILGEPVGTVKARTSRALARLKTILSERE